MTTIDFRTDPAKARHYRVVSLVTLADIPDIVWADDRTGCYGVRGRDAKDSSRNNLYTLCCGRLVAGTQAVVPFAMKFISLDR